MLVVQSESPFFNADVIRMAHGGINEIFPLCKLYLAYVPTYPSGMWSFTVGSKKYDPEALVSEGDQNLQYYNANVHRAAFQLPNFVKRILGQGE